MRARARNALGGMHMDVRGQRAAISSVFIEFGCRGWNLGGLSVFTHLAHLVGPCLKNDKAAGMNVLAAFNHSLKNEKACCVHGYWPLSDTRPRFPRHP